MNLGRDSVDWSQDIWSRLDQAVHSEIDRTGIASKLLPLSGPMPDATTVPADVIDPAAMTVSEDAVLPVVELSVEFRLTAQQVDAEATLATAQTLVTRAANLIAQAEDLLIFQGEQGSRSPIFRIVKARGSAGTGLLDASAETVDVEHSGNGNGSYGEQTVRAVARGYSILQSNGQYGPYALVLRTEEYADTFEPLPNTLIMPADRIRPLMTQGFYGTGTLPEVTGLLLSVGGASMDVLVGVDPITAFSQIDNDGTYRFRVFERFALRVKDPDAIVRLRFTNGRRS
jgi:uncharacterized linocin/CFP29 family protein